MLFVPMHYLTTCRSVLVGLRALVFCQCITALCMYRGYSGKFLQLLESVFGDFWRVVEFTIRLLDFYLSNTLYM